MSESLLSGRLSISVTDRKQGIVVRLSIAIVVSFVLILVLAGFNEHAQRLRALGFESRLKEMRDDPSLDVRERVRDALEGGFDPDPASHSMVLD